MSFKNKITKAAAMAAYKISSHAPTIKYVGGVALILVGTVWTAVKASKVSDTNEACTNDISSARSVTEKKGKALVGAYLRCAGRYIKHFGPSVAVELVGLGLVNSSRKDILKSNAALAALLANHQKEFTQYRQRVADLIGEAQEEALYLGIEKDQIEYQNEKTGKMVKEKVSVIDEPKGLYTMMYDESSSHFDPNGSLEEDLVEIEGIEAYYNRQLQDIKGLVRLNDVRFSLGLPMLDELEGVGWFYNPDAKDGRENCVMLKPTLVYRRYSDGSKNPRGVYLLNPNVDGLISGQLQTGFKEETLA